MGDGLWAWIDAAERRLGERATLGLLLAPALLVLLVAQLYPLVWSAWVSTQDWSLAHSPLPRGFIGLANYARAFADPVMAGSVRLTVLFALGTTSLQLVAGFLLALLTLGETLSLRVARTLLILPMVIAPIAVGTMWRMMLSARVGAINHVLGWLGIAGPDWLGDPTIAQLSLVAIDAWEWTPFVMVVYVAALTALPPEPLLAAEVDGATRWQVLRHVVWPMLLPMTLLVAMFRLVDSLLTLDLVFTTTYGGPGFATHTVSFWIYQQGLRYFNIGYAAASSWLLLLACLGVAGGFIAWRGRVARWQDT